MKFFTLPLIALLILNGCYQKESNSIDQYLALTPPQPGAGMDKKIRNK